MSDNIKVVVKVRPLISREIENKLPHQWRVHSNTLYQLDGNGRDSGQTFTFDKVYNEATKTTDVYDDVAKPIVEAAIAGFNGTIFAYGQTSSGKTYTMTGTEASPGIIPLSVLNLFEIIKNIPDRDFLVRVSYIEIYNETLKDLLDVKKENIRIHERYDGSIKVDATERVTSSPEDVLEAMHEGEANRQTGATNMNEKSSRSHTIFQITIESREHIEGEEQAGSVNVSQLNLVDLAGSERAGQSGATGIRFKEGTNINKSLSVLALVIKQLSDDPNKYANYRDSKLTRILQNSLGGNAKTSIICAITPTALEETISTLQFATRAKVIKNKPEVNAVATDATMIQSLTKQLSKLQSQLEKKKNLEVMLENKKHVELDLQKQIANLQKLILNGFGQRRSIEHIGGTRRKLQQPRRITISSLHSIDEDPVPTIPRFCTPSMKFNSMLIQNPSDFEPIEKIKLPSLPEEPPRLVTPPPNDKKVNFKDEVIEIDSDDDDNSTISTCSPYHKCYNVSKTPPCILRKNLNRAEKNYQDIIELTEREKIYKPDVVELMQKLDESANITAKLQEELEILKKTSREKDLEMEHLKSKIKKSEDEVKNAKMELETCCKNYDTKLTDWEVTYEILKKKASSREEELLSLLEEHKPKTCEDIGKLPPKPIEKETVGFMDMSKDISLVNSDNESSIITNSNEEESSQQVQQTLIANLQDQLIAKCQTIVQLEANIASQKLSIEFLEQSSHELQGQVDSFKEKVNYLESESKMYKSTIDTLTETIRNLKENLEKAQNDILSYNDSIQELRIKLTHKENLLNISISDSVLENMIANEEKAIANNENMKNIVHSFKITLDNRNKEIEKLKSAIQDFHNSQNNKTLIVNDEDKTKQINVLNEEILKLKEHVNDNIATINNLMREKSDKASVEQELTKKLSEMEIQKKEMFKCNEDNSLHIKNLKEENENLLQSLSNSKEKEQEYIRINNVLQHEMDELSHKIIQIEEEIKEKDSAILTLNKKLEEKQEYENHAKSALDKLKRVISILKGDVQEIPEMIENFVILIKSLSSALSTLEKLATETVSEKNFILEENSRLNTEILNVNNKFQTDKITLQLEIDDLKKNIENNMTHVVNLKETNDKLLNEISEQQKVIDVKRNEYDGLLELYNACKDAESRLNDELQLKKDIISSHIENENALKIEIKELEEKLKSENSQLQLKVEILTKTLTMIDELKSELKDKCEEITMLQENLNCLLHVKDQNLENILNKLCDITKKLNIGGVSYEDQNDDCYENVVLLLDKMISFASQINDPIRSTKKCDVEFEEKVEALLDENKELKIKLENNSMENNVLRESLIKSNSLLKQLQKDLEQKAAEIERMEDKTKECREQFINLDISMKQQLQDLRSENEAIKTRYVSVIREKQIEIDSLSKEIKYDSNFEKTNSASISKSKEPTHVDTVSPPTLLTICCNTIVESLELKQNDYNSASPSSSDTTVNVNSCSICDQLSHELQILQQENSSLSAILEQMERANNELIMEQEKIRNEVQLLLEPAQELQKKISSHKTNLSILTATTFAENRSLKSQVKALQHYHNRLHHVCQGDIPEFKRQLCELFVMLKGDSYVSEVQNVNLKRYSLPDVLDNNYNFKNESTLDGDLLMLDTNVTLTTTGDNTLVGYDQTNLDLTQTMFNEVSCQTNDLNVVQGDVSILENDSRNLFPPLNVLKEEKIKIDADSIPITSSDELCRKCRVVNEMPDDIKKETNLTQKLAEIEAQKYDIEKKYNNLVLEMPNTDALVGKLNALQKEYDAQANEVTRLFCALNKKNTELKNLQDECDSLSTQIMENISEADDLNKELDKLKADNVELSQKVLELESRSQVSIFECPKCQLKENTSNSVATKNSPHIKLNRSLSDSDTSSRRNKICTLQSELNASREDCKVLTEDMATIKQHLDYSNMSMDLDESVNESNEFAQINKFITTSTQQIKCNLPHIQEECSPDIYTADKIECYNYYLEITGVEKELVANDVKLIDIMKMFYNNLLVTHGNEVENLANKLKDYEESQMKLQMQYDEIFSEYSAITNTLEDKENDLLRVRKLIAEIKHNLSKINNELCGSNDSEAFTKVIDMFKLKFLNTLDYEFGMSSVSVFEIVFNKYQDDLTNIGEQCIALQTKMDNLNAELNVANDSLEELKRKLNEKESECNLLKAQKDKMHEISSAVTMDIVKKEQEMHTTLRKCCQKLLEINLITDMNLSESSTENFNIIIDHIIKQFERKNYHQLENEKEKLSLEVKESKTTLDEMEKELAELKTQIQSLRDINNNVSLDLSDKEGELQTLKKAHDNLTKDYDCKIQENINNLNKIDKLTEEIRNLKETITNKELMITSLSSEKDCRTTELLNSIKGIQEENEKLKSLNRIILKEKECYSTDLAKSSETINQNNVEMQKMTSDILVLRESVKEATSIIESLKQEVQKLSLANAELKSNFEEKKRDCSRLEMNIKTHEKTAEVQSRMIMRLQKQKEDDDRVIGEIQTKIDEVNEKYNALQIEHDELKEAKESLETRVSELLEAADRPRLSLDAIADSSRRRRQSMHDSRRLLADLDENRNKEAFFESRQKRDDPFMDVDGDDTSGRSTPFGLVKGRDSLPSRTDQSDKDEEHPSRPSSVMATRRRRQSIHDMHRGVARHTPSPHDLSSRINDEAHSLRDSSNNRSDSGEVTQLREQLTSCQQELEDLKERYRELDDECETCAEYLRERDEQCVRLKKEKAALEKQLAELKMCSANSSQQSASKPSVAHVAVNTDEDWANLHAVVVDRMSYDAEVDKNKRLTKTVEELRFQKQELRTTISKMQKALEKKQSTKDNKELAATKDELKSVKQELEELKLRYEELDEECETCAQYLREREEQCRKLKEAKAALESKLQELQEDAHTLAHSHSVRKKRQTIHDSNRNPVVDQTDASTATNDDLLALQVERDNDSRTIEEKLHEIKRLRMIVEKLTHQKAALEQQLRTIQAAPAPQPMYVATGSAIVQNQQLTDVMKENQRLKKINAKLVNICKKRGKSANQENEDPCEQG